MYSNIVAVINSFFFFLFFSLEFLDLVAITKPSLCILWYYNMRLSILRDFPFSWHSIYNSFNYISFFLFLCWNSTNFRFPIRKLVNTRNQWLYRMLTHFSFIAKGNFNWTDFFLLRFNVLWFLAFTRITQSKLFMKFFYYKWIQFDSYSH